MKIARVLIVGILLVAGIYYAAVVSILRFSLDTFMFPHASGRVAQLRAPYLAADVDGNELLIRQYGNEKERCVVFFPGQHGGIERYQRELFVPLVQDGISVFAVSYPGQDGASGRARLSELPRLVEAALTKLDTVCRIRNAVFVGRSLGSMVAALQAVHWRPKGLVLDGVSPSLSDAILAYMTNHWYLRPAAVLPIDRIIRQNYALKPALDQLDSTHVVVFQGSLDVNTPASLARQAVGGHANVKFIEVKGATHSNVYRKVLPEYVESIITLLGSRLTQRSTRTLDRGAPSLPPRHTAVKRRLSQR